MGTRSEMSGTGQESGARSTACDAIRPTTHFMPPSNWTNDPNGLIKWDGEFHLFYQHNPFAPSWATMHWGHAVSSDLVSWRHLPIALAPDSPNDVEGCFSGCCIDHDGEPTIIYTGVSGGPRGQVEKVLYATSGDGMRTWNKGSRPLLDGPPDSITRTGFRDPFVWREGDGGWVLVIGSGTAAGGGEILIYRSADLHNWDYRGVCLDATTLGSDIATAAMWEYPQLIRFSEADVLIFTGLDGRPETGDAVQHCPVLVTGRLEGDRFRADVVQQLDSGWAFRAPAVYKPRAGRSIVIGWLREDSLEDVPRACGWAGVLSYPRAVGIGDDGLWIRPAEELVRLRRRRLASVSAEACATDQVDLPIPRTGALEVAIRGMPNARGLVDIALCQVLSDTRDAPPLRIAVDLDANQVVLCTRSSADLSDVCERTASAFFEPDAAGFDLRVFVDASVVEVFMNVSACITERMYLAEVGALCAVRVQGSTSSASVHSVVVWELNTARERL